MKKVLAVFTMIAIATPALAGPYGGHWHGGGGGGWHGGGYGGGYGGGWHHGGGGGFGPGAAIAGGLLGLGVAGALAGSYYAYPQTYYAPQCYWVQDAWGRQFQQCY